MSTLSELEINKQIDMLWPLLTANKQQLFEKIIPERTNFLTIALENIKQSQNASAVLRSCDCFGIQNIHMIEEFKKYKINKKVVMGADKWVDIHRHENTSIAIQNLRSKGYKIVATTPHTNQSIDELPVNDPIAIFLGNEENGLSEFTLSNADYQVKIPMYGFSESFNVSVSAAIILNQMITKIKKETPEKWQLTNFEQKRLKIQWIKKIIKSAQNLPKTQ